MTVYYTPTYSFAEKTLARGSEVKAEFTAIQSAFASVNANLTSTSSSLVLFNKLYLGAKTSAPTTDNDGGLLLTGASYLNTTTNRVGNWNGSAWIYDAQSAYDSSVSALSSAGTATAQALLASGYAGDAFTYSGNALTYSNNANTTYLNFDKRYLGAKSSNPTVDNQGAALITGSIYWNTVSNELRTYNGSGWAVFGVPSTVFSDSAFQIQDDADSTKRIQFQASGITTGTTRTFTVPNASGTLALTSDIVAAGTTFTDAAFDIHDNTTPTKIAKFDASAITAATTRTYILPNNNGTIALTSDISALGGTTFADNVFDVHQSANAANKVTLNLSSVSGTKTLTVPNATGTIALTSDIVAAPTTFTDAAFDVHNSITATKIGKFSAASLTSGATRTYTLPDASGTLALTATLPTTFTDAAFDIHDDVTPTKIAKFDASALTAGVTKTYTLPDATGTIALTSNLSSYTLNTSFTGHTADATLHLTSTQNAWIDAITASATEINYLTTASPGTIVANKAVIRDSNGYIFGNYFNSTANDIGVGAASSIAVQAGDNYIRWQTPANLFKSQGQVLKLNSDRGRYLAFNALAQNGRLIAGYCYSFNYPQAVTQWYLPTVANSVIGDRIEIASMHWAGVGGWSSLNTLTIACDAGVQIGTQANGESFVLDDSRVQMITFICTWTNGTNSSWSIG